MRPYGIAAGAPGGERPLPRHQIAPHRRFLKPHQPAALARPSSVAPRLARSPRDATLSRGAAGRGLAPLAEGEG